MSDATLTLSVVTPERPILKDVQVESIVLPGKMGQFNILPGHTNFITTLSHGVFGYQVKGEWQIAFLAGGFTQVFGSNVTVLAETLEMATELDFAKAEIELKELLAKMKTTKIGTDEYKGLALEAEQVASKMKAAQKKLR